MLNYGKKVNFEVLLFLVIWVSQQFGDKNIGFNSCECIKYLNIANFHVFHVWGKRILSCNDATFSLNYFSFFYFATQLFFPLRLRHQTSATKLRYLRSSAFYRKHWNGIEKVWKMIFLDAWETCTITHRPY